MGAVLRTDQTRPTTRTRSNLHPSPSTPLCICQSACCSLTVSLPLNKTRRLFAALAPKWWNEDMGTPVTNQISAGAAPPGQCPWIRPPSRVGQSLLLCWKMARLSIRLSVPAASPESRRADPVLSSSGSVLSAALGRARPTVVGVHIDRSGICYDKK
ncbi:unnamed protein product [Pleuronectes platessa]|uniref:Uncharacterized protein n=1 Tax=Pleuronectes platessa TaxID=8262 RepID=A0A9N7VX63_PLEPL|nr:unnamed protein product [Pleuronectes platessa]